ncbi:hypothetical protein FB00_02400 [Cellulosimicrobium funkei]|uniref:Uncharacterized protein n=1 Tax=Cellulosimicrobium funkei TaxID=264251 RepID=A0A0H2L966_9MICO|nr:hypothetical protein [Cellulosimicrobium funkei]KLN36727.1 hypothetical protein FB00_02400 [Cellulosimicrobium funkei]
MSPKAPRGADAPVGDGTDVDALVDGLFALPLEQFVVARTAAAKEIKASGDAVGAERVGRLAKPTVAAWVVNQVARERPDDVAALVSLGDELRDATTDRDRTRIRTLDRLRRERVERVVAELRDAGEVAGRAVSATALDRLAETLTAAVMDPDAGALVRAGRLSQALQHVGFGIVDEGGEPADVVELRARTGGTAGAGGPGAADPETSTTPGARSARADTRPADGAPPEEDAVAAAEREVEETAAEVDRLEAERDEADTRVRAAGDAVGQVEDKLGRVEDELARLADEREDLRARLAEARDAAAAAQESLDGADARLDEAEERAAAARKARRAARRG